MIAVIKGKAEVSKNDLGNKTHVTQWDMEHFLFQIHDTLIKSTL